VTTEKRMIIPQERTAMRWAAGPAE